MRVGEKKGRRRKEGEGLSVCEFCTGEEVNPGYLGHCDLIN